LNYGGHLDSWTYMSPPSQAWLNAVQRTPANDIFDTSVASTRMTGKQCCTNVYQLQPGSMKTARVSNWN